MQIRELLSNYFENQKKLKKSYSLRDLARDIGVGKTTLNEILAGNREPSRKNMSQILSVISNDPILTQKILEDSESQDIQKRLKYRTIQSDQFTLISDWEYLAILNLAKLKTNSSSTEWISEQLDISQERAKQCVTDLVENGYLNLVDGKLVRLTGPISSTTDIDNQEIKKHHSQSLNLAEDSLYSTPVELREFLSGHIAICEEDIPKAKDEIFEFFKRFAKRYDRLENAEKLYKVNIQLFPLGSPD